MRLRNLALTVLFGLGVCGFVSAEESGNWFTRMFNRPTEKSDSAKVEPAKSTLKPNLPDDRIIQAQAALQRRQDVCLKLIEIAEASGDDDLARKAYALDRRAWDAYTAIIGPRQQPVGTVSVKEIRDAEKKAKGAK